MLQEAHVVALKEIIYQEISDASKEVNGFRHRLDISGYTVAQLEEISNNFWKEVDAQFETESDNLEQYVQDVLVNTPFECLAEMLP